MSEHINKIVKGSVLLATIRSEFPKPTAKDLEKELFEMLQKAENIYKYPQNDKH